MGHFLEESWRRRAAEERGEPNMSDRKDMILVHLEKVVEGDPELKRILEDVITDVTRYQKILYSIKKSGGGESRTGTEYESADRKRRLIHNRLISDLDLLSRECKKRGLDYEWRREIGAQRGQVTAWAEQTGEINNQSQEK